VLAGFLQVTIKVKPGAHRFFARARLASACVLG